MIDVNDNPQQETHQEWLLQTSLEAEAEADKNGYLTTEQVEAEMTKHKHEFYKKYKQAA